MTPNIELAKAIRKLAWSIAYSVEREYAVNSIEERITTFVITHTQSLEEENKRLKEHIAHTADLLRNAAANVRENDVLKRDELKAENKRLREELQFQFDYHIRGFHTRWGKTSECHCEEWTKTKQALTKPT